ncbi:PP2C family protein-serine/threonine phosphatase (plasmid) [Ralstonia sp. R-29]|uniref:PP2C family protein-serine/threonine phosphatase n=1 Tax=Ralstonia sp. R-29 TaxID=3404059 RepID=UPI003CEA3114
MKISHAQFSHAGSRQENQDAIGHVSREPYSCFVISDGVAGSPGGEVASQLAISTLLACAGQYAGQPEVTLRTAIDTANSAILAEQRRDSAQDRMAATVAALLIDRQQCIAQWAHLGDSRLYRFRRGLLAERTRDHTLVQQLADAGHAVHADISPSLLHRALGAQANAEPNIGEAVPIRDGDAFLLCTDGVWQQLPDRTIEHCLRIVHTVDDWLVLLAEEVRKHGRASAHMDNYSALAVWIGNPAQVTLAAIP